MSASSSLAATPTCERWLEWLWPLPSAAPATPQGGAAAWERGGRILLLAILLIGLPIALNREATNRNLDFRGFYAASRSVLDHGERLENTTFHYYLPSLDVAFVAIAWLPMPIAGGLWYALGCWSWIGLLQSANRYLLDDLGGPDAPGRHVAGRAAGHAAGGRRALPGCFSNLHGVVDGGGPGTHQPRSMLVRRGPPRAGRVDQVVALAGCRLPGVEAAVEAGRHRHRLRAGVGRCAERCRLRSAKGLAGTRPLVARAGRRYRQTPIEQFLTRERRPPHQPVAGRYPSPHTDLSGREPRRAAGICVTFCAFPGATEGRVPVPVGPAGPRRLCRLPPSGMANLLPGVVNRDCPDKSGHALVLARHVELPSHGRHTGANARVARASRRPMFLGTTILGCITAMCLLGWPLARAFGEMFWATILLGGVLVGTSGRFARGEEHPPLPLGRQGPCLQPPAHPPARAGCCHLQSARNQRHSAIPSHQEGRFA